MVADGSILSATSICLTMKFLTIYSSSNQQKDSLKKRSVPVPPSFCTAIRVISIRPQAIRPYLESTTSFKACQEPERPGTMLWWKVFSGASKMYCTSNSVIGNVMILGVLFLKRSIILILFVLFASLTKRHPSNSELNRCLNPVFCVYFLLTISL